MTDVTHAKCGGAVAFTQRRLDGEVVASTVLICEKCEAIITDTSKLRPAGAVCMVQA